MAKHHVSAAARGLPVHPAVFLAITPEIRRALELLAEASIALLDEIDAPVDELEADPDFEYLAEDDEDTHDAEPETDEHDIGWTAETGDTGRPNDWSGGGEDEDFVAPETSGGFETGGELPYADRARQKALFDPRLDRRIGRDRVEFVEGPDGRKWRYEGDRFGKLPAFPHDPPDRPAFMVREEIRRLNAALWGGRKRKGRRRK